MKQFAASEWQRAGQALETAALLIATDPEAAASRALSAVAPGMSLQYRPQLHVTA